LDVHLMCSRPATLLAPFREAGAAHLTVHVELEDRLPALLWQIKALGAGVGLAVNPPTPISAVRPWLKQIDLLLVMTVNPGFGGQSFIEETLPKIQQAAAWRQELGLAYRLEVTAASISTVRECARVGADTTSGTTLFRQHSIRRHRQVAAARRATRAGNGGRAARPPCPRG
jgi:ribulose-phosphate 3-epimerase